MKTHSQVTGSRKILVYGVKGVGAFYDPKSKRGGYGGEYTLLYYDNNGDGRFERFECRGSCAV